MKNINLHSIIGWLAILMPVSIAIGRGIADTNLSLISILFIVDCIVSRKWQWLREDWVVLALVLYGYSILRSLFVPDIIFALAKSLPWLRFILFVVAMQQIIALQPLTIKRIWMSLAAVTSLLAADALLQFFTGHDVTGRAWHDVQRLTGPYSKPVIGANIAVLAAPVLSVIYWRAINSKNIIQILSCALLVAAIYLAVFLSGERSAFIQINLAIIMVLYILNSNKRIILGCIASVASIIGAVMVLRPQLIGRQFQSIIDIAKDFPESVYGKLWIAGIKEGLDHPIFGVGTRYFEYFCPQYTDFCSYHPHNIYIEWFAEFGLVGLVLFLALLVALVRKTYTAYLQLEHNELRYLATGAMVAVIIKILPIPSSGFFKNWYAVPLWFMIGLMLSTISSKNKNEA